MMTGGWARIDSGKWRFRARVALAAAVLAALPVVSRAQTAVHGTVFDSAHARPVAGASVTLLRSGRSLRFARCDSRGQFAMPGMEVLLGDSLVVTCLGYARQRVAAATDGPTRVMLAAEAFMLREVQVKGGRIVGRQDTLTYDLTRFASPRDNTLKDLLRKLPGVEVADDGQVTVNGKSISRFTVEGLDLTGGRYNQLEENIKAKDVSRAEIIGHDQPVKALRNKVLTDDVAMNIVLKDSVRDRLMPAVKPSLLVGRTMGVGGSAQLMRIGPRRQWMYDAAADRTGLDLGADTRRLVVSLGGELPPDELPTWHAVPVLAAPIDARRLRFNTSYRLGANRIRKLKDDGETRFAVGWLHTLERQTTANGSVYHLGEASPVTTTEQRRLQLRRDELVGEWEHKVNAAQVYGRNLLRVSVSRLDGLAQMGDTLSQRVRLPEVGVAGQLNRVAGWGGGEVMVRAVADYHHSLSTLTVGGGQERVGTHLWHGQASVGWLRKRFGFTQSYTVGLGARGLEALGSETQLLATVAPSWQYERGTLRASFTPRVSWERFCRRQQSFVLWNPAVYLKKTVGRHSEWTISGGYAEQTGAIEQTVGASYRLDYRSFFAAAPIVPIVRTASGVVEWLYKRPVQELFLNANMVAGHHWRNALEDLRIADGIYHHSLVARDSQDDFWQVEGSASKGFYALRLKMRLAGSMAVRRGVQLSGGETLRYTVTDCRLRPMVEYAPWWGAVSYESDFRWMGSSVEPVRLNWTQRLGLTATLGAVDLTGSATHYRNELRSGHAQQTLLADAQVVWRLKKVRLTALLSNLFDKRRYEETRVAGIGVFTDSYHLRGRELVVSAQYSF